MPREIGSSSAPSSNTRLLLARDHAAPESTLALTKAAQPCCGRVRPLAWCSRPRSGAALLEGALEALVLRLGRRRFCLGAHPKHAQPGNRAEHRGDEQKGGGEEDRLHWGLTAVA